jgi:hypothetical protein
MGGFRIYFLSNPSWVRIVFHFWWEEVRNDIKRKERRRLTPPNGSEAKTKKEP